MNTTEDSNTDKLPVDPCETKQSRPKQSRPIKCDHSKHHLHWRNTAEYQMEFCPVCSHIRNFWFKSFWKRLKSLFKNETL